MKWQRVSQQASQRNESESRSETIVRLCTSSLDASLVCTVRDDAYMAFCQYEVAHTCFRLPHAHDLEEDVVATCLNHPDAE